MSLSEPRAENKESVFLGGNAKTSAESALFGESAPIAALAGAIAVRLTRIGRVVAIQEGSKALGAVNFQNPTLSPHRSGVLTALSGVDAYGGGEARATASGQHQGRPP
jgi:hypothetical protein